MVAEKPPAVRASQPLSVAAGVRFVAYRRPAPAPPRSLLGGAGCEGA